MTDKIKKKPRLITSIVSIIMIFFTFLSRYEYAQTNYYSDKSKEKTTNKYDLAEQLSGIDIIDMKSIFMVVILISIFIILVDIGVVKYDEIALERIILICQGVHLFFLIWMYKFAYDITYAFMEVNYNKLKPGIGFIISIICVVLSTLFTLKKAYNIDVLGQAKERIPVDSMKEKISNVDMSKIKDVGANIKSGIATKAHDISNNIEAKKIALNDNSNMIICDNCGASIKRGIKFCTKCGNSVPEKKDTEIKRICRNCNIEYSNDVEFCGECGGRLEDTISKCKKCNFVFDKQYKFCPKCGEKTDADKGGV